jgi:hypothetical protein
MPMTKPVRSVLVTVLVVLSPPAPSAQPTRTILMRIGFPNNATREFPVNDGDLATIQFLHQGSYHTFYLRPVVRNAAAGLVLVAVHEGGARDSRVLDGLEVTVGQPFVQSRTTPSFGVAVSGLTEP